MKKIKWLLWIIISFLIGVLGCIGLFYLLVKFQAFMGWDVGVLEAEDMANWFSHVR